MLIGVFELDDSLVFTSISAACMGVGTLLLPTLTLVKNVQNMTISETGKDLIKSFEGLRLKAYQDAVGVWTIGWGHTGGVMQGQIITKEQAEAFFDSDIKKFESGVKAVLGNITINQNQYDALVSLAYNIGLGNLQKSTLLKVVKSDPNNKSTIRAEFAKWKYAGGVVLEGLVRRRAAEADLYCA